MSDPDGHKGQVGHEALLEHAQMLFRYALTRVGEREAAEDLVQETLVTAVAKLTDFAGQSSLRTWLTGILRHKILDHYRQKRKESQAPSPLEEGRDPQCFDRLGAWRIDPNLGLEVLDEEGPCVVERAQLRAALKRCIEALPPALQRAFVLREVQELEPEEVCEAAALSRESLHVFLYRARQNLRECMQRKWGER
mgnify:CR=1 FL=1